MTLIDEMQRLLIVAILFGITSAYANDDPFKIKDITESIDSIQQTDQNNSSLTKLQADKKFSDDYSQLLKLDKRLNPIRAYMKLYDDHGVKAFSELKRKPTTTERTAISFYLESYKKFMKQIGASHQDELIGGILFPEKFQGENLESMLEKLRDAKLTYADFRSWQIGSDNQLLELVDKLEKSHKVAEKSEFKQTENRTYTQPKQDLNLSLLCVWESPAELRGIETTVIVNLENKTIWASKGNGISNPIINDNSFSYMNNNSGTISISRITGKMVLSASNLGVIANGSCVKNPEKKF